MDKEVPKGGGICFICKEPCEVYWYWHPECKKKYIKENTKA